MATHRLSLREPVQNRQVGNSMNTRYSFDGKTLTVEWKGQRRVFAASEGSAVMLKCQGGFPEVIVMIPPSDPLARVAWEHRFYGKKRFKTLADLEATAKKVTFYSAPHGCDLAGVKIFTSPSGNCAVAYRAAMNGWVGTPWGWWANESATPEELKTLINKALGVSALHVFTTAN